MWSQNGWRSGNVRQKCARRLSVRLVPRCLQPGRHGAGFRRAPRVGCAAAGWPARAITVGIGHGCGQLLWPGVRHWNWDEFKVRSWFPAVAVLSAYRMPVFSHDGWCRIELCDHAVDSRHLDADFRADGKPCLGRWFELLPSDSHTFSLGTPRRRRARMMEAAAFPPRSASAERSREK